MAQYFADMKSMAEFASPMREQQAGIRSAESLPVVVYTPASGLRSPARMARQMWRDLKASRELALRLMVRDISARYRQSYLGVFWAFLSPITTALVFVMLNRQKVINIGATDIPYPAFVMFGTVLWQLFAESISAPLDAVNSNRSILTKINFPREALVLSGIGQILFNLGIKFLILAAVFVIFRVPLTWGVLLAPFAILMLMLLGIALGLLITPLGTLYQDVSTAMGTVISLWFFATPVVYPPPQRWPISLLSTLNPVSPLLSGTRDLVTKGTLDEPIMFAVVSVLTLLVLILAWILYRLSMPILIERMSA
jgi:lipopolysaccharide transport system permease protein